jgi:hypothetical protein
VLEDRRSRLESEYLIGPTRRLERRREVHELGLFMEDEMLATFASAGPSAERRPEARRTRGLFVARAA